MPNGRLRPVAKTSFDLRLAVAVAVAQDADAVGAALGDEQVAVRRGANDDAGF